MIAQVIQSSTIYNELASLAMGLATDSQQAFNVAISASQLKTMKYLAV